MDPCIRHIIMVLDSSGDAVGNKKTFCNKKYKIKILVEIACKVCAVQYMYYTSHAYSCRARNVSVNRLNVYTSYTRTIYIHRIILCSCKVKENSEDLLNDLYFIDHYFYCCQICAGS